MKSNIRYNDKFLFKKLSSNRWRFGHDLASLSNRLASGGVRTPLADYQPQRGELKFPRIDAVNGSHWVKSQFNQSMSGSTMAPTKLCEILSPLVTPLVKLHAFDRNRHPLKPLDPWRRIRPRLSFQYTENAQHLFNLLVDAENELGYNVDTDSWVPVHGDYHIGQLLFDNQHDEPWVVDLDDFALFHPESDVGNLAAHLVTADLGNTRVFEDFLQVIFHLRKLYMVKGGRDLDFTIINFYGAVAMLRRALKLHEQGIRTATATQALAAAYTLTYKAVSQR